MKTIANIMIINSQNVKPEHLVISSHHNISFQIRKCYIATIIVGYNTNLSKIYSIYPYFGFYSPFISCQSRDKML